MSGVQVGARLSWKGVQTVSSPSTGVCKWCPGCKNRPRAIFLSGTSSTSAELMGGLRSHDRPAIASLALTTDSSFITAWSNDTDYESIFSRQIEALGNEDDILVAISTSGNSTNVINAINTAKEKKLKVIILTGKTGGKMAGMGGISICVPSNDTQRIQECHLLVEHILCESVEESILN